MSGAENINITPAGRVSRPDAEVDRICAVWQFNPSGILGILVVAGNLAGGKTYFCDYRRIIWDRSDQRDQGHLTFIQDLLNLTRQPEHIQNCVGAEWARSQCHPSELLHPGLAFEHCDESPEIGGLLPRGGRKRNDVAAFADATARHHTSCAVSRGARDSDDVLARVLARGTEDAGAARAGLGRERTHSKRGGVHQVEDLRDGGGC